MTNTYTPIWNTVKDDSTLLIELPFAIQNCILHNYQEIFQWNQKHNWVSYFWIECHKLCVYQASCYNRELYSLLLKIGNNTLNNCCKPLHIKDCKSSEEKWSIMLKHKKLHAFVASLSGRDIIWKSDPPLIFPLLYCSTAVSWETDNGRRNALFFFLLGQNLFKTYFLQVTCLHR